MSNWLGVEHQPVNQTKINQRTHVVALKSAECCTNFWSTGHVDSRCCLWECFSAGPVVGTQGNDESFSKSKTCVLL